MLMAVKLVLMGIGAGVLVMALFVWLAWVLEDEPRCRSVDFHQMICRDREEEKK